MICTFEPPHIGAGSTESQIAQIKSYLTALSEQLNFAAEALEKRETEHARQTAKRDNQERLHK